MSAPSQPRSGRFALTTLIAALAVVGMTGMSFAAVPLYKIFCQVTGYGGTTQTARAASNVVLDQRIEVRFDANVSPDLPIEFEPLQRSETLKIGETGVARFRVHNLTGETLHAQARFNVAPHTAGSYFRKLECFCFDEQTIGPHETRDMPVVYFVDPEFATDAETKSLSALTLSYTFFTAPS